MSETKIDYVGFTYNGVHSSELGIVRVSDGSRFNENLLPTMQDKTVQVPGGDGTYYFGSYYTQRQFSVNFAFDGLTEEQVAKIKTVFGDKGIHDLIFDELPYKVWSAKVTGSSTLKYIPFAEGNTNRLYKGEGSIQFTCYKPYARSRWKFIGTYDSFLNREEWEAASGCITKPPNPTNASESDYDDSNRYLKYLQYRNGLMRSKTTASGEKIYTAASCYFDLYNPGDIPVDFKVKIGDSPAIVKDAKEIVMKINNDLYLKWAPFKIPKGHYVIIDTSSNLIEEYKESDKKKTGKIYNEYIIDGNFFKIPVIKDIPKNADSSVKLSFENICLGNSNSTLQYDYYYF